LGKLYNLIFQGRNKVLRFLSVNNIDSPIGGDGDFEFVKGFLEGVSAVPIGNNKCYESSKNSFNEMKQALALIMETILDNSETQNYLSKLKDVALKLKEYEDSCNLKSLVMKIFNFSYSNLGNLWSKNEELEKTFKELLSSNDNKQKGRKLGLIISIVFDYNTN